MTYTRKANLKSGKFSEWQHRLNYERLLADLELETNEWHGEEWCSCPLPYGNHPNGDRNASFSINIQDPDKMGLYNCFICGGGNIIQLVSALKGLVYSEAEDFVSQYLLGKEENFVEDVMHLLDIKDKITYNIEKMPEYPTETLFQYHFVHPWMREQGFTDDAIRHFQVGYDADRQGVLFPHWWRGKLVGWQLRDLTGEKKAKYVNTPHFPKRSTLFHYDCDCVRQSDTVVVVESPKSVVKMWSLGMKNVVATFGAEVNPEQMAALWNFDSVYLWFDNDEAGAKAYDSGTKYLRGMVDLYLVPPVDKEKGDPGDFDSREDLLEHFSLSERTF